MAWSWRDGGALVLAVQGMGKNGKTTAREVFGCTIVGNDTEYVKDIFC